MHRKIGRILDAAAIDTGHCRSSNITQLRGTDPRHMSSISTPSPPDKQATHDPGLGTSFDRPLDRLMAGDGSFRVRRVGGIGALREAFLWLVGIPGWQLVLVLLAVYAALNLTFGSIYMLIGVEHIGNADVSDLAGRWTTALGMSVQTLTTVGYGSLYPNSPIAWGLASIEGMFGILGFSLISAIIYSRFARPTARLAYSAQALIAPFRDGWSLQMRMANRRGTLMMEVKVRMLLVMADVDDQGERLNYYNLPLQFDKVSFMPLSWTPRSSDQA
jgi:inward rectifier potassium channel